MILREDVRSEGSRYCAVLTDWHLANISLPAFRIYQVMEVNGWERAICFLSLPVINSYKILTAGDMCPTSVKIPTKYPVTTIAGTVLQFAS